MLAKFMFNVFCVAYCTVPYWMLDVNVPYNMFIAVPLTPVDASRDTPTLLLSNVRLTSPRAFCRPSRARSLRVLSVPLLVRIAVVVLMFAQCG